MFNNILIYILLTTTHKKVNVYIVVILLNYLKVLYSTFIILKVFVFHLQYKEK